MIFFFILRFLVNLYLHLARKDLDIFKDQDPHFSDGQVKTQYHVSCLRPGSMVQQSWLEGQGTFYRSQFFKLWRISHYQVVKINFMLQPTFF